MKVSFYTLGCRLNQAETIDLMEKFAKAGYEIKGLKARKTDLLIINTCSVTKIADKKSKAIILKEKKKNPQ